MINQKGFIFDMDGTITQSQSLHYKAYAQVFKEHGIEYSREEDQTGYAGKGAERTFREVFSKHGKELTEEEIANLALHKREIYMQMINEMDVKLVPQVEEFINLAIEHGKKLIIATGSNHKAVDFLLKKTDLKKYFPTVIASADVEKPKPAPDIFLLAAEKINIRPADCVVFEDASMGIIAAKAAGMYCIGIATSLSPEQLKKAGADMVITDYNSLMN